VTAILSVALKVDTGTIKEVVLVGIVNELILGLIVSAIVITTESLEERDILPTSSFTQAYNNFEPCSEKV